MAHEIENEMIAFSGQTPWHGIGARLEAESTPEEFLKAAGLEWELNPFPLVARKSDGTTIPVPNKVAHVRSTDDKVMVVSGDRWRPLQNRDTLDFMRRYCEAGGAVMETAGGLRDGQIVWALAKINHSFEVRPGDRTDGYLLITSPHVVGQAITVRTTSVRVVCANTMAMAGRNSETNFSQNHMTEFDFAGAHAAVETAHEQLAAAEARCKTIDRLKLNLEDAVKKVIIPVFAPAMLEDTELMKKAIDPEVQSLRLQSIINSMLNAPGAIEGTGWGVLNGVTHYCDHVGGRNPSTRMYRSWIGDYSHAKLATEQKLLELV